MPAFPPPRPDASPIDRYVRLAERHPALFASRSRRRLVLERSTIERWAEDTGRAVGVLAETPYRLFVVDLVEADEPDGTVFRYSYERVIDRRQLEGAVGVVTVGIVREPSVGPPGTLALVRQERHATGRRHLELPRGFGEPDTEASVQALDELRQETGLVGEKPYLLGETCTDSGLTDARAAFYRVDIVGRQGATPERTEAIDGVQFVGVDEVETMMRDGTIDDSFTIQAYALLMLSRR